MKTLIFPATLIATLLWSVTAGYAQGILAGTVRLSDTERSAQGAYVYLTDLERAVMADADGAFRFDQVPRGIYTLKVTYIGYQTLLRSVRVDPEEDALDLRLTLEPMTYELEGVVITGGYLTTQDDNAIKIEQLQASALRRSTHFLEALARVPGVEHISRGPGIGKPIIRGLSNNQILVLNNGVRNENYQYADNHPIGLDEWGVERIEVIKGPASLLYGSGAIGGVVNLIKEPVAAPGAWTGEVLTQYHSNTQGVSGTAGLRAGGEHFFGGVRIGGKSHADYLDGDGAFVPNTRFHTLALRGHAGYRDHRFTSRLYYDFDDQKLGMYSPYTKANVTERGRDLKVWYQDLDNHLLNWDNTLAFEGFQVKANVAWQGNHRRLQNPKTSPEQPDPGAVIDMFMSTISYNAKITYRRVEHLRLIGGFQGLSSQNTNDRNAPGIILPDGRMNDYGVYGLLQYEAGDQLNAQLGLRYDLRTVDTELTNAGQPSEKPAVDEQFSNMSASVGATYSFSDRWLVRANLASGFRAPNLIELSANGLHGGRWERGDAGLRPERTLEADLSGHYHGDHLTMELAGFYNQINQYIFLQPTEEEAPAGGGVVFQYAQDDSRLYGLEGSLHLHPAGAEWLHVYSTYAWVYGEQDDGTFLPLIPAQRWNNELGVQGDLGSVLREAFFRFTVDHTFDQDRPARFELLTDGYTLLGLHLGSTFFWSNQRLEWQVSVNNLLDESYFNHLSTLRPLDVLNPGRNVVVTLRLPFGNR